MLTARFNHALDLAARLHARQVRKGSDIPYVGHLLGVCSIALEHGATEDEAIGALLHDALEDAPDDLGPECVARLIARDFGRSVLEIVEGCTDTSENPKPDWRPRKEKYLSALAGKPEPVLLVSASDKVHNARAILSDYLELG